MSDKAVMIVVIGMISLLLVIIFCQQFLFQKRMQGELKKISEKLADILERDSDEKVMFFTDDPVLMDLLGQINRMLLDRQKVKIDYRKQELSSKKMLANISHDIKTPLTVILGYLEIMRIGREECAWNGQKSVSASCAGRMCLAFMSCFCKRSLRSIFRYRKTTCSCGGTGIRLIEF